MPPKIISSLSSNRSEILPRTELDRHADSPVVGKNCLVIETLDKTVDVRGFTSSLGTCTVPLVNAALLYTCAYTGEKFILIIYNALYVPDMEHNLLPPFMMRLAGLELDEKPKFLTKHPSINNHSFFCPQTNHQFHLHLAGTVSYFPTDKPTPLEYSQITTRIELTPPSPSWIFIRGMGTEHAYSFRGA